MWFASESQCVGGHDLCTPESTLIYFQWTVMKFESFVKAV